MRHMLQNICLDFIYSLVHFIKLSIHKYNWGKNKYSGEKWHLVLAILL